ncbi:hypothetical protein DB31_5127 [Hyalangium minutum]|uniref:JAB domain-containing protein n=2 Tax=Hyalangium minutum TaxID=394096 RepID=A0A085WQX2_9BACT|nr:hypothetical protein DB31_5127 [Hyalangium minutum]
MEDFGRFDSFMDALDKACDLVLSKPHASVVGIQDPELAQRVADEYCAWLYYASDEKYHMSMLTNQSDGDEALTRKKTCRLPASVDDPRFPAWSIKYVFALHNHPFGGPLSLSDLKRIIAFANTHEWVVDTKDGKVPLAMVAFFSNSGGEGARCDGFYQYTPETRELVKFTQTQGEWFREDIGRVTWVDEKSYKLNEKLYRSR